MVSSVIIRFLECLGFDYWRRFWWRIEPPSARAGALNDGLLLTQRYRLTVLVCRPHALQPNFFLPDEVVLDHQDLLDDWITVVSPASRLGGTTSIE
jgi:hypothetical protein